MSTRTYHIETFGCQMNAHDSENIAAMLVSMGYEPSGRESEADIIVYNTCCVRESAENKIFGNLGHLKYLKERRGGMKIALCGCMTQQSAALRRLREKYHFIDIIFGTHNLRKFPELLRENIETGRQVIDIWEDRREEDGILPSVRASSFKASVNIMYGCDNFCSYCIVPYVRGREKSRPYGDILHEIRNLAEDGAKEILLLGQNVNSYGKGEGMSFAGLLRESAKIEGVRRVRFMTSHPKDLSDDLIEAIRETPNICKHVHLPMQSGSDAVLRAMNRKYTKEKYLDIVTRLRSRIPGLSITTDIIVGFPGETDEDFEDTLDVVRAAEFEGAFTFIYSKRSGTPAAEMENQVDGKTVAVRFDRLLETVNPIVLRKNQSKIGTSASILAEGRGENGLLTGRADDNSLVHFAGGAELIGELVDVKITDCKTFYLVGEAEGANREDER